MFFPAFPARGGGVLRERFHDVVEAQPQTPTVMIEGDREGKRQDEEHGQHNRVVEPQDQ